MESPNGFSIEGGKTLNRNCNSIWVSKALFYECQSLMKAKRDESTVQSPGLDTRWKDHEEPWDKVVLLCNSLRYLSTVLVFYVLHQEIEPCVTDINPAPIKIRSHNTLRQHIYWHSWQFLSPGDAKRQQQEPLQRQDWLFFSSALTLISDQPEKQFLHTKWEDNHHFCITGCLGKSKNLSIKLGNRELSSFSPKALKIIKDSQEKS